MAFKLPEGSPATYIKKLNATIFTASHKQSTILPKSSTVCCVFKSWKGFYRFLGVSAINVNLQEDKKHSIKKKKTHSILLDGSRPVVNINYIKEKQKLYLPLKKLWQHNYTEAVEKSLLLTLHQTPWSEQGS